MAIDDDPHRDDYMQHYQYVFDVQDWDNIWNNSSGFLSGGHINEVPAGIRDGVVILGQAEEGYSVLKSFFEETSVSSQCIPKDSILMNEPEYSLAFPITAEQLAEYEHLQCLARFKIILIDQ